MDGGEEVVLALFEHLVVDGDTGRNQLNDTAFHEGLGEFGIFELLADGHAVAGAHESRQVRVEGVVGKPRQFGLRRALPVTGQRDT